MSTGEDSYASSDGRVHAFARAYNGTFDSTRDIPAARASELMNWMRAENERTRCTVRTVQGLNFLTQQVLLHDHENTHRGEAYLRLLRTAQGACAQTHGILNVLCAAPQLLTAPATITHFTDLRYRGYIVREWLALHLAAYALTQGLPRPLYWCDAVMACASTDAELLRSVWFDERYSPRGAVVRPEGLFSPLYLNGSSFRRTREPVESWLSCLMPQDGARADDVRQTYHALHTTIAARDGSWMAYHLPPSDMSFLEIEQERRRTPRWWPESIASEEARNAERVVARSALREAARPSVPNVVVRRIDPTD